MSDVSACVCLNRWKIDIDACLGRIHPGTGGNGSGSVTSASIVGFTVTYTGKSAHAGVSTSLQRQKRSPTEAMTL